MTLTELMNQCNGIKYHVSSTSIPIKQNGEDVYIKLELKSDNGKLYIELTNEHDLERND